MRSYRARIAAAFLGLGLILGPAMLEAQVGPPGRGMGRQRQQLERQIRLRFQEMVREQLGLSDETLQSVQGVMQSFQEERMELGRAQASVRHRLQDPGLQNVGDDDAMALLSEMVLLQERELELYRQEQEQLLVLLSPSQLVRFYALREGINRRIQEMRGGRGRGSPGGGGGLLGPEGSDDFDIFGSLDVRGLGRTPGLFAAAFGERYIIPIFR